MSLRLALLALLSAEPMTGYDVVSQFDDSVGYLWHATHPQIYPELHRLEDEGLVQATEVRRGRRGVKRQYALTDSGVSAFRESVEAVPPYRREKDGHRLQASYFEWAEPETARELLRRHIAHHTRELELYERMIERLRRREVPLLRARLQCSPPEHHDRIVAFKIFAYEGAAARARVEIDWARDGLELVDRLGPSPEGDPGFAPSHRTDLD